MKEQPKPKLPDLCGQSPILQQKPEPLKVDTVPLPTMAAMLARRSRICTFIFWAEQI